MKFRLEKPTQPHRRDVIALEPETDDERETLERLLDEFPAMVAGFGRDAATMEMLHMQLRVVR